MCYVFCSNQGVRWGMMELYGNLVWIQGLGDDKMIYFLQVELGDLKEINFGFRFKEFKYFQNR